MLFLTSIPIKITICIVGYILMKITSVQLNGNFTISFRQMNELETNKISLSY